MEPKEWSAEDRIFLAVKLGRLSDEELAERLGVTEDMVRAKMAEMGHERTREQVEAINRRLYIAGLREYIKAQYSSLPASERPIADFFLEHDRITDRRAEMMGHTIRHVDRVLRKRLGMCLFPVVRSLDYRYYLLKKNDGGRPEFYEKVSRSHPCGAAGTMPECHHHRRCYLAGRCPAAQALIRRIQLAEAAI